MAFCIVPDCGEEYSDKRLALGYETCLDCGRRNAVMEARRKATRVAPAYNKGGYQYISDETDLTTLGKKV